MSLEQPKMDLSDAAPHAAAGARNLTYIEAVNEALHLAMDRDPDVFVIGQNVTDETGVFGSCIGLLERFGPERVLEAPLSEAATGGWITGAAIRGKRPVLILNRPDFLFLMMDQLLNHANKWHYMFNGQVRVPLTVWAPVARGWGTGCQHTQALHGVMLPFPGLKMATPATAADGKGLLLESIFDDNPCFVFDHRWAMRKAGKQPVKAGDVRVPFASSAVARQGQDVTVITFGHGVFVVQEAAEELAAEGVSLHILDLRSVKPMDREGILNAVRRTGRAVVFDDTGWAQGGTSAEISALIHEELFADLKAPVRRVTCPDAPTPSSFVLEAAYYPGVDQVIGAVRGCLG